MFPALINHISPLAYSEFILRGLVCDSWQVVKTVNQWGCVFFFPLCQMRYFGVGEHCVTSIKESSCNSKLRGSRLYSDFLHAFTK